MDKNIGIMIGLAILVVIVGGVYASTSNNKDAMVKGEVENTAPMEKDAVDDQDTMMQEDGDDMTDTSGNMMKAGSYEPYAADKLALAATGDVILFFSASWCPSCRGLNTSIESDLNSIPEGVTILKLDYDKETALKKKYGVTYQHTLVQVDKDGNMIKKWSGGSTLDGLLAQIQ